jgi:[ribosomal protein S5]-alanine N-acetyltransferase
MTRLTLPEQFETERLLLQRLRYENAEEIFYSYASKPEATKFMAWPTHQSVSDARSFLNYTIPMWDQGLEFTYSIRVKDSNRFIGGIGAINEDGKVQVGYVITPTFWGQGITTEACTKLVELLKKEISVHRIWTFIDSENIASAKVLLKSGFIEEARLAKWFRFINQGNEPKDCTIFRVPLHN